MQTNTYNLTIVVGGIPQVGSTTVTVKPAPAPSITGTEAICPASSGIIYFTESGMADYVWTITSGGIITGGLGTNVITVNWLSSGTQIVTVNYTNASGCRANIATSKTITVWPTPTPVINGPVSVCNGATTTYSTEPGMTNYQWTLSSGGTVISGINTNTIVVNWNTIGFHTITVSYINASGCPTLTPTIKNVAVNISPTPTISGSNSTCLGGTITFTTEAGQALYQWTVSAGGIITSGEFTNTISVKWNVAGSGTVSVNYTNTNNCSAPQPATKTITVYPLPVPVISGPLTSCSGTTGVEYSTASGMTNYIWNVSSGGTITAGSGTNTIIVTWNLAGNQTVSVNYTNAIGCAAATPTSQAVVVSPTPVPSIIGNGSSCVGTTGLVYSTEGSMSGYLWTISSGGTITSGQGSYSIHVTWIEQGAQTLTVNYTTPSGCTAGTPTSKSITVNPLPVPTISGSEFACITENTTHVTEGGMTGYQWTISSGGTILSGGATNSIVVQWTTPGQKTVSVNYTSPTGCTAAAATEKNVMISALPVPVITGNTSVCQGSTGVTYTTEDGMTNYSWTISPGGTITSGSATNVITVTWNALGLQQVSVNYTNVYGCSAVNSTVLPVTVNPLAIATITGSNFVCANSGNYTYSTEQGMQNYLWTVTSGGIIVGGHGTNSVQINWSAAGNQSVGVAYTSPAGCTTVPATMNVTVKALPDPHGPISGDTIVCKPQTGVIYSVAPIPNAEGYVWNVPVFANITSGANTNIITVDFGTTVQSGNVSVFGINSCGNGPNTPLLPVMVNPVPETPHVTVNAPDTLLSSALTGNQWYHEYVPIPGATEPVYLVTAIGRYYVITTQNGCVSAPSNVVYIFPVGMEEGVDYSLKLYPNPADDEVTVSLTLTGLDEILSIKLVNNLGQESRILPETIVKGEITRILHLGNPPDGIYHLVLQFGNHKVIRKLIIINE